jgi:DNA recombination protein RmuC
METLSLVAVFLTGIVITWIIFYLLNKSKNIPKNDFDNLLSKYNESVTASKLTEERANTFSALNRELTERLNSKENSNSQLQNSVTMLDTQLKNSESKTVELSQELTKEREMNAAQQSEINSHKQEIAELTANNKSISENLSAKNEINNNQTRQIEELNAKLTDMMTQVSTLSAKNTFLDTQLKNSESKTVELSQELTKERETNATQQNEINSHKQTIAEFTVQNKSISNNLSEKNEVNTHQTKQIEELNTKLTDLTTQVNTLTVKNTSLTEKLTNQKTEIEELQKTAHLQFEKIANKLLEEKSVKFTETNRTNIEVLLNPLKEDINKFKTKVEETYDKESKQRFSLEEKVKDLIEQTNKVSAEANNLATALKGNPQKRGNWGEMILERILESSGLTKDREYFIQQSIKDEDGNNIRPDVIVQLPDERTIIIDSKVSLIAYDKFIATDDAEKQKIFLNEHLNSMYVHIDQLSSKRYDDIVSSLDFIMMFVPIEPAYLIAMQGDANLWSNAYSKRILLISPTNLIACLKLISDLWRREWQNKNAKQIVAAGEALYEKFVGFTQTFEDIGRSIKGTQDRYDKALGQLKDGRGNLVNQAIKLKNLGLKSNKKIPANLLPLSIDDTDIENESEQ